MTEGPPYARVAVALVGVALVTGAVGVGVGAVVAAVGVTRPAGVPWPVAAGGVAGVAFPPLCAVGVTRDWQRRGAARPDGDDLQRHVKRLSDEAGTRTPRVAVTDAAGPRVVPLPGIVGEPRLLVSEATLELPDREREAAIAHGVVRLGAAATAVTVAYGVVAAFGRVTRHAGQYVESLSRTAAEMEEETVSSTSGLMAARVMSSSSVGARRTLPVAAVILVGVLTLAVVGPFAVLARHAAGVLTRRVHRDADRHAAEVTAGPDAVADALRSIESVASDARETGSRHGSPLDGLSMHPVDESLLPETVGAQLTGTTHPSLQRRLDRLDPERDNLSSVGPESGV